MSKSNPQTTQVKRKLCQGSVQEKSPPKGHPGVPAHPQPGRHVDVATPATQAAHTEPETPSVRQTAIVPKSRGPRAVLSPACHMGIQPPAASKPDSKPASMHKSGRKKSKRQMKVQFAHGPFSQTHDGHPPHEGELAKPVRRLEFEWGKKPSKREVLQLEELLGSEYRHSVDKLKKKCGLLPMVKPARPFAQKST